MDDWEGPTVRARKGLATWLLAGAAGLAALGPLLWVTATPAAAFTSTVNIVDKPKPDPNGDGLFDPNVLTVNVDTKVLWTNKTSNRHTVTSDPGSISFDSGDLRGPGGQFEFRFQTAGTYTYHCTHHPKMVGRIEVVDPNAPTTTTTAPPTTTTTAPPPTTTTAPPTTTTTESRPAFGVPTPPATAAAPAPPPPSTTTSVPSTTTTTTVPPTTPTSAAPVLAGGEEGAGPPASATTAPPPTTATTQPPGGDKNQNAAGPVSSDGKLDVAAVLLVSALVAVGAFGAWTLIRVRPGRI